MRAWLALLALGIFSGCASKSAIELPAFDAPPIAYQAVEPIALPPLPELSQAGELVTLDRAGLIALMAYVEAAKANTEIARQNAAGMQELAEAHNALAEAGRLMVEFSRIREEQLHRERSQALQDRIFYRTVIVLSVAGAFLASEQ